MVVSEDAINIVFSESRLDILTQESLTYSRSGPGRSQSSSLHALEDFRLENDDSYWSWNYLKKQISYRDLDDILGRYRCRIKQSAFTVGLFVLIVFCLIRIPCLLCFTKVGDPALSLAFYGVLILLCVILLIFLAIFHGCPDYKMSWYIICGLTVLFTELADYAFVFYNWSLSKSPRLSPTFIFLIINYCSLPFPHPYITVAANLIIATIELFFSGFVFYDKLNSVFVDNYSAESLAADAVFLVTCNLIGIYKLYLDEVNQRRAFLDHCHCIESELEYNEEKLQEEKLMKSILPPHIVSKVLTDLRSHLDNRDSPLEPKSDRLFSDSYIEKHENVSILFSDIVNSVKLTSNLTAKQLVVVLNDLFSRFDASALYHKCERLRILGDCYIAVSGLSEKSEDHAKNCVAVGLDMINVIRSLRETQRIDIDMRIGVHSGKVMSGILGISKLQFDIWSSDVEIAHLLEQTGKPGRVHVSNQTKELLGGRYWYEESTSIQHVKYALKKGVTSYFICHKEEIIPKDIDNFPDSADGLLRKKNHVKHSIISLSSGTAAPSLITSRRNQAVIKAKVKEQMDKAVSEMALSKREQWFRSTSINPLLLLFDDSELETHFSNENDPLYKYYLLALLLIFMALFAINSLTSLSTSVLSYIFYVVLVFPLVILIYSAWHDYIMNVTKTSQNLALPKNPKGRLNSILTAWSRDGFTQRTRILIFIVTCSILAFVVLFNLSLCTFWNESQCIFEEISVSLNVTDLRIEHPRFYTYSISLVIAAVASFLKIHYFLKLIMYIILAISFNLVLTFLSHDFIFESFVPSNFLYNEFPVDHSVYVIIIVFCHHLMDRQFEYLSRLDYLWKCQLKQKKEESSAMHMVNTILFRNIVPVHVGEFFLNSSNENKFYNEDYTHVAVMFASIPNFSDFYDEIDENEGGLKCLIILDKIIQELDKVILKSPEFHRVEKIKVIGSTYMAAAGLKPNRRSSVDNEREDLEPFPAETNVITLVNLAFQMAITLEELNKTTIQEFQFRIGIDFGSLSAGVVGAQRPFYDIWGDPVNVASRMESTGEMGKIQVTERTAELLMNAGYACECRGLVFIKGKGNLKTYFVTGMPQEIEYEESTKF